MKREKRLHPRIAQELPLKIAANGYDFVTSTKNLSCLGAYCRIDKYVPPFTKIAVKFDLPVADYHGLRQNYNVACNGVIVRSEDDISGGFNVAIFFNEIKDSQRKIIIKYVNQFLPQDIPT
ncbi:MAG: PilZ domain-containing protein [Candidatus Omnitrophota bacterium]